MPHRSLATVCIALAMTCGTAWSEPSLPGTPRSLPGTSTQAIVEPTQPLNPELMPDPDETVATEMKTTLSRMPDGATRLLTTSTIDNRAWTFVSAKRDADHAATWQAELIDGEPVLTCSGTPYGLIRSTAQYKNFQLGLEWRFPDGAGNSGVLVHTNSDDKVWPSAIQVQLHDLTLGSVFPLGGAMLDGELRRSDLKLRPKDQWNSCVLSSNGGSLVVEINGTVVGTVTGANPAAGAIAFQSEGSLVQFRRVWILPTPDSVPASQATMPTDSVSSDPALPNPKPPISTTPTSTDAPSTDDRSPLRESSSTGRHWRPARGRVLEFLEPPTQAALAGGDVLVSRARPGRVAH